MDLVILAMGPATLAMEMCPDVAAHTALSCGPSHTPGVTRCVPIHAASLSVLEAFGLPICVCFCAVAFGLAKSCKTTSMYLASFNTF